MLTNWLNDIPSQFSEKPRIKALIKSYEQQLKELYAVFDVLKVMTDLDKCFGENLDHIGNIVSLSRVEAAKIANASESDMNDDLYRQYLRFKILQNTSEGTYYNTIQGLNYLVDESPRYIEDLEHPARFTLALDCSPSDEVVYRMLDTPIVKPAGVKAVFQVNYTVDADLNHGITVSNTHDRLEVMDLPESLDRIGAFIDENDYLLVDEDGKLLIGV